MFTSFTSYEVSLLIRALNSASGNDARFGRALCTTMGELAARLERELAKEETKAPEEVRSERAYHEAGQKATDEIRSDRRIMAPRCDRRPIPSLAAADAIIDKTSLREYAKPDPQPPATVASMGSAYHLLKFIDDLREEQPHVGALQTTSTPDILELIGQTLAAARCSGKDQTLCHTLSIRIAQIVNQIEGV